MRSPISLMLLSAVALSAACGGASQSSAPDAGAAVFVAVQGDFAGYRQWTAFDGGQSANDGIVIEPAQRTIYMNKLPPHDSTDYPVGTIIVKDTENANTFAMAKRGGDFNSAGAVDWEFFELVTDSSNNTSINWRGTAPPVGETYGNTTSTSCNGCHTGFKTADYVGGGAISLSQF